MYRLVNKTLPANGLDSYDRDSARVMTAMTFDDHGEPIDYFKQVFAAFEIAKTLARNGIDTDVLILIADHFVLLNQSRRGDGLNAETINQCAKDRMSALEALTDLYAENLEVNVQFTSELQDGAYNQIVESLGDRMENDPTFKKLLLRSVPKHHRDPQSSPRENTRYTREELATIIRAKTDIKIGPHRERLYDAAARDSSVCEIASDEYSRIIGAYVTDSYPTAVPTETIEQLRQGDGLLPYKANSHGFDPDQHRIMLRDSPKAISRKIQEAPTELQSDIKNLLLFMNGFDSNVSESLIHELKKIRNSAGLNKRVDIQA